MTGILQIKRGKYYCVLDYKDETGKRKRKWINTNLDVKGNKRNATDILNKLLSEYTQKLETPTSDKAENMLFTDYMEQWLEKKKDKIETITFEGYKIQVDSHIYPYFKEKNLKLSEIKPSHIADFYEYKFKLGRCDGKGGLSIRSVRMLSFLIKAILDEAVFYELISINPASKVPLPKKKDSEKKCVFLDAKSANEVLKLFRGHPFQPLIYMTLYYGLRRSEVLGLKWNAIDFKKESVEIKHTVVMNLSLVAKDKTKTAAGKRTYALLPELKEVLLKLKNETVYYKKMFGEKYQNTDYIFTWPDGRPYRPDYVTKEFQKVLIKNDFPKMRFHDLRHSCASVLYDKGWELKDIQTWLGHADIQTTANVYTHISNTRKNDMAKDIQNTFSL